LPKRCGRKHFPRDKGWNQIRAWQFTLCIGLQFRSAGSHRKEQIMGELTDKAKGLGNELAGNIKQAAGRATNNPQLEAEGIAQERKGEAQGLKGKVKGALGDKV
jgi:uncharacterized protein YjbJ (UPF0337 family)